jgi:hypothetical protein
MNRRLPLGSADEVAVVPVATAAELERFIRLPMRLNSSDPNYIAPLLVERRAALSARSNPFFSHAEVQLWLAVRDGRDVGRISAQIDALAPTQDAGHFGLIAAEDDPRVFRALFAAAEGWLTSRGRRRVLGPFNLSVNEELGLLIDGFDTPPMVMMGHDPPYAAGRVEEQGYRKAKDLYAYYNPLTDDLPEKILKRVRRGPPPGVRLRQLDWSRYDAEVEALTEILNDAWSENWGYTPTTGAETRQLAAALRPVLDRRLTWFAEIDGETAAFIVLLPNVNEAIADLQGRLAPLGWAKVLWRLKVKRVKTLRVPLMGVRRKFAGTRRGQLLPFLLMDAGAIQARALGYGGFESSWVLEDNRPMRSILEAIGARIYKTYRIYEKSIA